MTLFLCSRDGLAHAIGGIPWTLINIENVGKHANFRLILKDVHIYWTHDLPPMDFSVAGTRIPTRVAS